MARLEVGYLMPTHDQTILGEHEPERLVVQARRAEKLELGSVGAQTAEGVVRR
ncbi:hypothetical protein [Nonomuraea roseola]|uniref:Uncharacterized protein n=1 Tax=Nonomuraea roseola TaxID=46179 RepID=A0ABV5QEM2_9ACTN